MTSRKACLKSAEHWGDIVTECANQDYKSGKWHHGPADCKLCVKYRQDCNRCPLCRVEADCLVNGGDYDSGAPWRNFYDACALANPTARDYRRMTAAALTMQFCLLVAADLVCK